ncbi:MAG: ABC transporter ATP-binding protein [Ectothiorhodospiraceae bacterium]|nr:ABC transporter ATP-binding protein [Chromatiales bacterium]MCP5156801.1 ABC transporter ATP-binding protein [Ectothiorhodospiraceae bacterium]
MSDAVPALVLDGVRKRFGSHVVLDGIDLEIPRGEFFGLVGVNGAGKTTSIKALLDFSAIDGGAIRILGVPHREVRARDQVAFLPERFLPPYFLTGAEFLRHAAALRGESLDADAALAMCAALDLDASALARPVRQLSKGMAQKLGLASCFLSRRALFVLDEPMSGLDPKARLLVKRQLTALRSAGPAVFFSTHMLTDVEELCDRMGILHQGRLRFVGSPAQCRERFAAESLEAAYLACIS